MKQSANELLAQLNNRAYNFSAGPAPLPLEVLEQARDELLDWQDSGTSVMEVSHRGAAFMQVVREAESDLRDLLNIPENYHVLFLQGGARGQFAAVPLNLMGSKMSANYVDSGFWAHSAIEEARRYLSVNIVTDGAAFNYNAMPEQDAWQHHSDAAYLHYTTNETIGGLQFPFIPQTQLPLVADMSSDILSQPIDVSRFAVIYAGAQKNIGPAGLTLAIVRDDVLGQTHSMCPSILDYTTQAAKGSMYNTPPTFAWYLAGLVFKWLKSQGGLQAMAIINQQKATLLYEQIDGSSFYHNPVDAKWRSTMNVPFTINQPGLDPLFLQESEKAGFRYLKGHAAAGGMRASIYNAVPLGHVQALVEFMTEFERIHG